MSYAPIVTNLAASGSATVDNPALPTAERHFLDVSGGGTVQIAYTTKGRSSGKVVATLSDSTEVLNLYGVTSFELLETGGSAAVVTISGR